jgi:transposase
MSKQRSEKVKQSVRKKRRRFTDEFKAEAVQMLLDGHAAGSICERLGLSSPNVLYRWKREAIRQGGHAATGLEGLVRELEAELRRVERERDILKKALSIFGRAG